MWQFVFGSDAAFAALEQGARRGCVRFQDQEMPRGASPSRATVGFEIDAETGDVRLLVEGGVSYTGPSDEIRSWLRSGHRVFGSFAQLRSWLATTLRSALVGPAAGEMPPTQHHEDRDTAATRDAGLNLNDLDELFFRIAERQRRRRDDSPS